MKAKELDEIFDKGEDITPYLDLSTAERPGYTQKRISVDFPQWMLHSLDHHASKMGVTRQAVIKMWLAERLQKEVRSILAPRNESV